MCDRVLRLFGCARSCPNYYYFELILGEFESFYLMLCLRKREDVNVIQYYFNAIIIILSL